ncbi:GntR family transcriptional regulator [Crossiella sp. NPDC003009]
MASGRDRAYEFLKDTVLGDPAMQGQFINEQELADRIGVSRTPIREALLMLAAEDLLRLVPKKGAYIPAMTMREIKELMELRELLERHAAERVLAGDRSALNEMAEALEAQRGLLTSEDSRGFIEWDRRFHAALVSATGNQLLVRVYDGLRARQVTVGVAALGRAAGRREAVLAEHELILNSLAEGDGLAASLAITTHLQATLKVLLAG